MSKYKHYKGEVYTVLAIGRHTETGEDMTVYEGSNGEVWVIPSKMFNEYVIVDGKEFPRFTFLSY